ncbi:hypothetical protein RB195_018323 [Necator americanus]|uniref:PDZ domain-containing protein n=1 Tax=Necator americanus TaxID=51031 RepID=A0ABR1C973_NECAM
MRSPLLRKGVSLVSQARYLLRPPKNLPYRGIYRTEGETVRKDEILVCQRSLNYHPGLNVYFENDRGERLLRSSCDGIVCITTEVVNPDMSNPEMAVYEHRKDIELRKLTFNVIPLEILSIVIKLDVACAGLGRKKVSREISIGYSNLSSTFKKLSEFFNAVREVYETVYDIVDIEGSPEFDQVRASATAKATVAAFAAAEGHAHPRVVELPKTDQGLGFNVMGGKEQNSPIYISRIIPGGVADRHGGLRRGDQLIAVNGVNVESECHERAVDLLKSAQGTVRLVVRYTPRLLDEMERRFERQRRRLNQPSPGPPIPPVRR